MVTYEEFVVLAALNLWLEDGLPEDYVAKFAASCSEGDPRGAVSVEACQEILDDFLKKGWAALGKASDGTDPIFAYSTPAGTATFNENKDYWIERARRP